MPTFAAQLRNNNGCNHCWRGGRVVDCGGLENRCTVRYPGFESLSLRCNARKINILRAFFLSLNLKLLSNLQNQWTKWN